MIRRFIEAFGVSGSEQSIREVIISEIEDHVDELTTDTMGNLIAIKGADISGPTVMFSAHMDQIGLIITEVDDDGFLRFSNVGGIAPLRLLDERVIFANGRIGCIGAEKFEQPKELKLEKLFIDIGCSSGDEARQCVSVGDVATFHQPLVDLGDRLISRALDDRIGCAILAQMLRELGETENRIAAVFSVQEEVGLRGARTAAYQVQPDLGIAIDVTGSGDTPKARRLDVSLGEGAAIKVMDRSLIAHPGVRALMVQLAEAEGIPYQMEVLEYGGTDAGAMQLSRSGVPAGCISIPTRYLHGPSEMVDYRDVRACVDLALAICRADVSQLTR
ncbi:MAG: M42 family metallopeptidase [Bacillota bacterium]